MATALEVHNLAKGFGGVPVLRDVSFSVDPGTLTVLAGENGAGKSTLMKIITGQLRPDHGHVVVGGTSFEHSTPQHARALGVAIVPQELAPYPDMLVYENLFVGRELRRPGGLLNRRAMISEAKKMLDVFGVDIDPKQPMRNLSVALTQLVEIAKATTWGARILLLDEPTSAIPEREVDRLYSVVRRLKDQGVAMLYTTHRMAEIEALADQVVVLRDGLLVMDEPIASAPEHAIVQAMIGRPLDNLFPTPAPPSETVALRVRGLQLERGGPTVDFDIRKGEILGLGGLVGAGRTEILEGLFGLRHTVGGTIAVGDTEVARNNPAAAIRAGLAVVP